jgi:hypothetical protein
VRSLIFAIVVALLGCSGKPAEAADQPKLNYKLTRPEKVTLKVGQPSKVGIVIAPLAGAHIDPRAPLAFSIKSAGAGTFSIDKAALGHEDGKERDDKSIEFGVPVTGQKAGSDSVVVHADFYLCTAKICERQQEDVTVAVVVE